MAADTFGAVWRQVRNHCPLAPAALVQFWVQHAYDGLCDQRLWSHLRAESEFLINDSKTGTCNVTRGSASVSGGTLAYAVSDIGRQFRVNANAPIYSISDATITGYTLDRVFGDTTATGATARVGDFYLTCPADFRRFIAVLDTHNNWQLHIDVTEEELNTWDAQRSAAGTPWALASRRLSTLAATDGRAQYELWPYALTQVNYPFYYKRAAETLTDDSVFKGVLATGNVLVNQALIEASRWPGVEGRKNPYFNLALAEMLSREVTQDLARLEVVDEEIYLTWLETVSHLNRYPYAPLDSRYLQSHDIGGSAPWGATWPH